MGSDGRDGRAVRVFAAVLAPFVAAGEAFGNGVVAFFSAAERLNPVPLVERLARPLADLAQRGMRWFRNPLRPVEEFVGRILVAMKRALSPVTSRLASWTRGLRDRIVAFARRVLQATAPFRERLRRVGAFAGDVWARSTAPARALAARSRALWRRAVARRRRR